MARKSSHNVLKASGKPHRLRQKNGKSPIYNKCDFYSVRKKSHLLAIWVNVPRVNVLCFPFLSRIRICSLMVIYVFKFPCRCYHLFSAITTKLFECCDMVGTNHIEILPVEYVKMWRSNKIEYEKCHKISFWTHRIHDGFYGQSIRFISSAKWWTIHFTCCYRFICFRFFYSSAIVSTVATHHESDALQMEIDLYLFKTLQ